MDIILNNISEIISAFCALAGCIGYISWKEKKREAKLENDKREAEIQAQKLENNSKIIADCYAEIERLKATIEQQNERIKELMDNNAEIVRIKDDEIHRLNTRLHDAEKQINEQNAEIAALREELDSMKAKRNAKGQFTKKQ